MTKNRGYSVDQREAKVPGRKKKRKLWKMVWDTSKPVIAAYLAKKLAEKVRNPNGQTPEKEGVFLG